MTEQMPQQRSRGCASVWGPFRPLIGTHTVTEVACSAFLPTWAVALYRLIFTVLMLGPFIYYTVQGDYSMRFYSSWSHLGLGISFLFLTLLSITLVLNKISPGPSKYATISLIAYQIFASAALFLMAVYWILLYDPPFLFKSFAQHGLNIIVVVLDILLSLRYNFRISYVLFFVIYTIIYLAFAWIRFAFTKDWVYDILDYRTVSAGRLVATYIGLIVWGVISGLLIMLFSRLSRIPCLPQRVHQVEEKHEVAADV